MNFIDKMVERFLKLNRRMKRWQRVVSVLAAVVVFATTYALVLPAITLDSDTAATQAGIDVAASENEPDEAGTVFESQQAEETAEEEDSSAESGSEEAEAAEAGSAGEAEAAEAGSVGEADSSDTEPAGEDGQTENLTTEEAAAAVTNQNAEDVRLITEDTQLKYETDDYIVYADFGESAKLPEGVQLRVKEITKESDPETYESYYQRALSELQDKYDENTTLSFAKFYDIAFVYENTEIEPGGNVSVRIEYKKAVEIEKTTTVDTIHFDKNDEEKAEVIDSDKEGTEKKVEAIEFKSDQFSVYGIVGTESISGKIITASGKTLTVTVTYEPEADIPADARLDVREILPEDEDYKQYYDATVEAYSADSTNNDEIFSVFDGMSIIDISILSADGEKIQPAVPVQVNVSYDQPVDIEDESQVGVVHFGDETEVLSAEADMAEGGGVEKVSFEAASFSKYSVVFVRDIQTQLNGKTFAIGWWNNDNGQNFHYYAMTSALNNGYLGYTEVSDTSNGEIDVDAAAFFTFEKNPNNNTYRISTLVNGQTRYLGRNGQDITLVGANNATYFNINLVSNSSGGRTYPQGKITITPSGTNYTLGANNSHNFSYRNGQVNLTLVEVNDYAVESNGIKVHYVKEDGTPIDLEAYPDKYISETLREEGAANYSETYLYGDIYDLYLNIPGYAYDSTHLSSYDGTQINVENVFISSTHTWEYEEPNESTHGNNATNYDLKIIPNGSEIYVVYKEGSEIVPDQGGGSGESLDEPKPEKTVISNHDGTYEMTLRVNASSKPIHESKGANVIVIFDRSASMSTGVPGTSGTRLSNAVSALENITSLLDLKDKDNQPLVEMKLIPFNASALKETDWTTDKQIIQNGANGSLDPGTCWESAVEAALDAANAHQDGDKTYIIFLTDGNPWEDYQVNSHDSNVQEFFHHGSYFYTTEPAREIVRSGYELYGVGMYGNIEVLHYLMNFAYTGRSTYDTSEDAHGHFFSAARQDELIDALQKIAGTIEGSLSMAGVDFKDGIALSTSAKPDTTMTALKPVTVDGVTVLAGVTYSKTDGETADISVTVDSNGNAVFEIDGSTSPASIVSKTYERIREDASGTDTATANVYQTVVDGVTYEMPIATLNGDGELEWDLAPLEILENGATYSLITTVWPNQEAYDLVTDLNNGMAEWNEDEAEEVRDKDGNLLFYKGGAFIGNTQYEHVVKYPTNPATYAALSNTHQTMDYYVVESTDEGISYTAGDQIPMKFPDPMGLAENTVTIKKEFEKDMMPTANQPPVVLDLLRDGEQFITGIELNSENDWETTKFIAPGMMITKTEADRRGISGTEVTFYDGTSEQGREYVILNTGYDYKFSEEKNPDTTQFQLEERIYHPMLVGNEDGSTMMDVEINGTTVTLSENDISNGLVANNQLKGGININKVVQDINGVKIEDSEDIFEAQVTLTVPMKDGKPDFTNVEDEYEEDEQGNYKIDEDGNYVIATESVAWYRYYDSEGNLVRGSDLDFAGETNHKYGTWFMLDFDNTTGIATGTVRLHPQYTLRFTNMAAGTTYSVVETEDSAAGYIVSYSYTHQKYEDGVPSGEPTTDEGDTHVVAVNQANNVTIFNKHVKSDLIIIKADDKGNAITSADDTAQFKLVRNTAADGSGSWVNAIDTDNDPHLIDDGTVTIQSTDGVELKGLEDGLYQLTEIIPPSGYIILTDAATFRLSGGDVTFVTITETVDPEDETKTIYTVTEIDPPEGYTKTDKSDTIPVKITVANTPGAELPNAGGPGTLFYTLGGLMLVIASALMYGFRMRRGERRLN